MGEVIGMVGFVTAIVGLLLEVLAVAAMAFYPARRMLPISPIALLSAGGICFFCGTLLAAIGIFCK